MEKTEKELQQYLLAHFPRENESCEWKEFSSMKNQFCGKEGDDVVSYVSALANMEGGSLVMGIKDKTLDIVGIDNYNYDQEKVRLRLKDQCTNIPIEEVKLTEFRTSDTNKLVWVLTVPKHSFRLPVYAHSKAWQRIDDSLVELTPSRLQAILEELPNIKDWSAEIVPDATLKDLDDMALAKARIQYAKVHSRIGKETIDSWPIEDFLAYSGVMVDGQLTRAALLLLGTPMSAVKLRPAVAEVTWILKNSDGTTKDYEHFGPPFILTVDDILKKIRNITMRELTGGTLFPDTMQQYDDYTIRELLHNCIAHQDYTLQQRVNFVEREGSLYYENGAVFLPGNIERVIEGKAPQRYYRNHCLCDAMAHFNMIDKVGRGIQEVYRKQKERHFPMPDYEINKDEQTVSVTVYGKVIDEAYTNMLLRNTDLSLKDCILLDAVQKKRKITEDALKYLREKGLIEGRRPNVLISKRIAKATGQQADYSRNKGFEEEKYEALIINALEHHGELTKEKIKELLYDLLPKGYTLDQKRNRVDYSLKKLRTAKRITYNAETKQWKLVK